MSIAYLNIQEALFEGNTKPLWDFLKAGGNIQDLGKSDVPFYACDKVTGDLELVKLLFERGMKLNEEYSFFCRQTQMSDEVFDWALDNNLDKAKTDDPVLFNLVCRPKRFKRVVERGANINVCFGKYAPTTLIASAALNGQKEMVSFLVEKGADINASFHNWWSAIFDAAHTEKCDVDMLEHLVKLGADYRARYQGQTLIMVVSSLAYPEKQHSVNKLKYLMSLYQGWADEVDDKGNTALHLAAEQKGAASVIKLLLSNGFDPTLVNKNGKTPIEICISKNTPEPFQPFWSWIQNNPSRFLNLGLQELCDKHSADKIKESINIRA